LRDGRVGHGSVCGVDVLPEDHYWDHPEERQFHADYNEFTAAATAAGVLRGGEALYPASSATTITVKEGPGGTCC